MSKSSVTTSTRLHRTVTFASFTRCKQDPVYLISNVSAHQPMTELTPMIMWWSIHTTKFSTIFTGRNEVVAKVIFLHLFVILFTGGVSASVHAGIPPPPRSRHPPGADTPLSPRADTPPE